MSSGVRSGGKIEVFMALLRLVAASLVAVLFAASTTYAQTPTLAELARREQERRKAVKAPAKVLKAEQVPKATPAMPSTPAAPSVDDPSKTQKPDDAVKDDPAQQEAAWKARMSALREELRRGEMFAEALQTRINSLSADFTSRDDPYQRQKVGEERLKALAEFDRVKAEIELVKKKIADAEEEARRAGVPPGWLR
jgi:chromosome segregation ATPase